MFCLTQSQDISDLDFECIMCDSESFKWTSNCNVRVMYLCKIGPIQVLFFSSGSLFSVFDEKFGPFLVPFFTKKWSLFGPLRDFFFQGPELVALSMYLITYVPSFLLLNFSSLYETVYSKSR